MKKINKKETSLSALITPGFIESKIHIVRGKKVMLDSDLAELYQVSTKRLNEQVKRNSERFPKGFMFQLTKEEASRCQIGILVDSKSRSQIATLDDKQLPRFQIGTLKKGKNIKYLPYVFTELGVAMLSSVLKSDRAVQMNIYIMRAFVKLREIMATNKEITQKIEELEMGQQENREDIEAVAATLKQLMDDGANQKDAIGFVSEE